MNHLKHLAKFEKYLANYRISKESATILASTRLALFVAPTSAGRNTVINQLLKTGHYHEIISDTTRQPRSNDGVLEKNGIEYWFKTENEFLQGLHDGKYIEAAIIHNQQVSGISAHELSIAKREKKIAIMDIEIRGTSTLMSLKPDTVALFMLPPNFEEWQRRIKSRGKMARKEYHRRLQSARHEFIAALHEPFYTFVINSSVMDTVQFIDDIVRLGKQRHNQQVEGRKLTAKLLKATETLLESI